MIRRIIRIDEDKCNGCGACAAACHEGAITMVNGKARLTREDYCDGLGDCLPACPMDAISFEEREAPAYDEEAVRRSKESVKEGSTCSCPGSQARVFSKMEGEACPAPVRSRIRNWPVQLKLAPVNDPYFNGAHILLAADCAAYAYGNFHEEFIKNRVTLIGCPKLDGVNYADKLTQILAGNDVRSLTIVRMEVPCCGGLEFAAKNALMASGKFIPWRVVTISCDGRILEDA